MTKGIQKKIARIVILTAIAAVILGAAQSEAYCVYNKTQGYISEVHGEFCGSCLASGMLSPGGKVCCPGNEKGCRGETLITVSVPGPKYEFTPKMHYGLAEKRLPHTVG